MEATSRYAASLKGSPAEEYLVGRGLGSVHSPFRLGYVDDPLPGHGQYRGCLAIPYLRVAPGDRWAVVSLRFRRLVGDGPKYMTVAGDTPRLYNTRALLQDADTIAICEGELDAITAQACGVDAVGVPGAASWKPHFREPFLGYEWVYILADGDDAGRDFADHVKAQLPNARVIEMPAGQDVNSLVLSQGRQALLSRIGG
ncbi:toprim domain-containing protein [Kitasatospora sp. NPDC056184]|uniref:toprim domain-containing protein n=1 Tax=Kitasatospora sp. NPDC056184 TaxID=3345738 RepID=UPI0035D9A9A0